MMKVWHFNERSLLSWLLIDVTIESYSVPCLTGSLYIFKKSAAMVLILYNSTFKHCG